MAVPAFLRLAGHPVRWRLLAELAGNDLRVRELVARLDEPQNLVSYHLRLLRDGGLVTSARSSHDGRDTYYHLDLDRCADGLAGVGAALHPFLRGAAPTPPSSSVLFVCTGNSVRSPIAEELLRRRSGGRVTVLSAGTHPRPALHPHTARLLREEFGVDPGDRRPQAVDDLAGRRFDHVITLCDRAREVRPAVAGPARPRHWSLAEPDGYDAVARTAAALDTRIRHLIPALEGP